MPFRVLYLFFILTANLLLAQSATVQWDMGDYRAQDGLTATADATDLTLTWDGADAEEFRMVFTVVDGTPTVAELAVQESNTDWSTLATDLRPEYRIVSGVRRVTMQQTEPLEELGVPLTAEKLDEIKWNAFWDAPLFVTDEPPLSHASSIPAAEPYANHPGLPRQPEEIERTVATYAATGGKVVTDGARLTVTFPNATAGVFTGYLQFDVFRGTGLIRQTLVASTDEPSVAFKYDAGLAGLSIDQGTRLVWRDLTRRLQEYRLGGPVNAAPVTLKTTNRLLVAELPGGTIAAFAPPHSFYWARESEENLGYNWYRRDPTDRFSFGIRQAEGEDDPEFYQNFALYSARPGTQQRMPVFYQLSGGSAEEAVENVLAYTNDDTFRPLPGHRVMGHHYHVGLVDRLQRAGGLDQRVNDVATMKGIGMDIYSVIDGARGPGRKDTGELYLRDLANYYTAARNQSDDGFLLMPSDENSTGGRKPFLGGHYEIIPSHPIYWRPDRQPGEPLYEEHPEYGTVYNLGTAADMMAMTERENVLISLPHPDAKRSTGYPYANFETDHFRHPNYFAMGFRWGMGIDASETRLGEYRFLALWDSTNTYLAGQNIRPKFAMAISEARSDLGERGKPPYDEAYAMAPVNYLRIDAVPSVDDMSPIVDALRSGDYFVTSGEVLIPSFEVQGSGEDRTVVAKVSWTFPLDFVELVWSDGVATQREVIATTDLPAFGSKRFELPFAVGDKKWVRFAAYDVATNGAMVQPVWLGE